MLVLENKQKEKHELCLVTWVAEPFSKWRAQAYVEKKL